MNYILKELLKYKSNFFSTKDESILEENMELDAHTTRPESEPIKTIKKSQIYQHKSMR